MAQSTTTGHPHVRIAIGSTTGGDLPPNPEIIRRLEVLGSHLGKTISVISGWRSDEEQAAIPGYPKAAPGQSHHRYGIAADCQIDGGDIQDVVSGGTLRHYGLWPLTEPHDPAHVEILGKGGNSIFDQLTQDQKNKLYAAKGQIDLNTWQLLDPTAANTGGGSASTSSLEQVASVSQATAFATSLEFPGILEMAEAMGLVGQKSLLNDKPLLPFIQQLAEASLRQFMSMPNGNLFFFYPDYFGEAHHRAPYWEIDDIEILNGKIELSDDSLATHVYVVGDTTLSGGDPMTRAILSRGTITIQNAFQGNKIVNTKANPEQAKDDGFNTIVDAHEALQFLQRYGARPLLEDMPMIHSGFFEMFLAYQLFMKAWSRQFLTQFTFTFMPELFPGGKVGFPQHALQMYIEEVEHSFDYESGFITQATLSSPSVYAGPNTPKSAVSNLPPNMVRALIEPAKNVTDLPKEKKPKVA